MTQPVLVTGATGYVGGRLVPRLLELGYPVRCLVRDAARLQGRPWRDQVEVAVGDAFSLETLVAAMQGVSVAYYLIHGMQSGKGYAERDLDAAHNFAKAAEIAGVQRIIYLGELIQPTAPLSPYLHSRHETGYILFRGSVPLTEFRAGMIIGSGSVLFEIIRYLIENQPALLCASWFYRPAQPIAIRNVLDYLVGALNKPESVRKLFEIGGPDRLTYADMLRCYARIRGLKRLLIRTPIASPRLGAYLVHMITPLHWSAILPLIEGLNAEIVVRDDLARQVFPEIAMLDFETAVRLALGRIENDNVETSWSDALVTTAGDVRPYTFTVEEGMMRERRQLLVDVPADRVFRSYIGLGGERGWLYLNWTWNVRGWIDKLVGGVGLRRGRRSPDDVWVGESLDFWRVEAVERPRLLRLRAEMKVPGKAWLEFQSLPQEDGKTLLTQTAYFAPKGVSGFLYWYILYPIHSFIFSGMIRKIAERAREIV